MTARPRALPAGLILAAALLAGGIGPAVSGDRPFILAQGAPLQLGPAPGGAPPAGLLLLLPALPQPRQPLRR